VFILGWDLGLESPLKLKSTEAIIRSPDYFLLPVIRQDLAQTAGQATGAVQLEHPVTQELEWVG